MTDRVAAFCLSLSRLSNDTLAMVDHVLWSRKLRLPPQFVARLVSNEKNRRQGCEVIQ